MPGEEVVPLLLIGLGAIASALLLSSINREARRDERTVQPRHDERTVQPRHDERTVQPRHDERTGQVHQENAEEHPCNANFTSFGPGFCSTREMNEDCSICMEPMGGSQLLEVLPCAHKFHKRCINDWLLVKEICPTCKTNVLQ